MNNRFKLFFKGMLMGVAEIIPGVSGGTIAFITGIYEELIESIKSINSNGIKLLFSFQFKKFWSHINGPFLITLLFGMVFSILFLSRIIEFLLTDHPFKIWGFFFGLIIASIFIIQKSINNKKLNLLMFFFVGLFLASYISLTAPSESSEESWFVFLSGALAISAMILPGISGSFILVFISKYEFILNALNNFELSILGIFLAGCVVGLLTFSRVLSYLFRKFNDPIISLLMGFLAGSLIKIWPFYEILETNNKNEPIYTTPILPLAQQNSEITFFIIFCLLGVLGMYFVEKRLNSTDINK
jgi:putative membrane protein